MFPTKRRQRRRRRQRRHGQLDFPVLVLERPMLEGKLQQEGTNRTKDLLESKGTMMVGGKETNYNGEGRWTRLTWRKNANTGLMEIKIRQENHEISTNIELISSSSFKLAAARNSAIACAWSCLALAAPRSAAL
ncbi:hypothetical protein BDZ89DRAFT_1036452 [Hymenopellis radicata]|nr:hypothetical protein BDZ89DRAFT_1036452 [Hymenopellis radicata]